MKVSKLRRRLGSWVPPFVRRRLGKNSLLQSLFTAAVIAGLFITGIILLWFVTLDIPSIDNFHNRRVAESTKIYDRTGEVLLYDVHGAVRRTLVPLEEVSRHIQNATIAIEDAEFYEHRGIRPLRTLKAIYDNIVTGDLLGGQGGSTITQQVVKNTILTPEKTITRKVKEWILALKLERQLEKDQILEIYLNETPYGGTIYGVEEASLRFFGKNAANVNLVEAAYLAALPQAPTYYSPYGNHREDLEARKNQVLESMLENNFITQEEYDAAVAEQLVFEGGEDVGIKAPHFVFFVREYLEEKYGANAVLEGGLQVYTTLDYELQQQAQLIVEDHARSNESRFNAENAGLVAIDPKTGHILAMVGSRDYFDENIDGMVNVTVTPQQPGSSFKPFVYAAAFAKGYTPETVVFDLKTQFSTACGPNDFREEYPCYSPNNYDNTFRGPMTLRNALAQSVNVPAVKVLYLVGLNAALDLAERMGITTLTDRDRYGLSLVLGGGDVTLLEMVSAYGTFATEGVQRPYTPILRVEDAEGNVLEEYEESSGTRVLDEEIARQVSDVLSDNNARIPAFGANSPLFFPGYDVAAKTGTTNEYRDAWIIGYSPSIVVGAWAGNNDNTSMSKQVAGYIVAPLWNEFMNIALEKVPNESFTDPQPIPTDIAPVLRGVWNAPGYGRGVHSILYWVQKDSPRSGPPSNPAQDSQFMHWEYPIALWAGQIATSTPSTPGGDGSPVGNFSIVEPSAGSTVPQGQLLTARIATSDFERIFRVSYYLNGVYIGSSNSSPFSISIMPDQRGSVTLRAVAETGSGGASTEVSFIVR